jgi:kynureninase
VSASPSPPPPPHPPILDVPGDLATHPNPLARHYARFRVADRLLLTGHSHQAWPDVSFHAQVQAWNDAARFVDDKWDRAFDVADRVRRGVSRLLDVDGGEIALGQNTFGLVARFLSALPLRERPRLVTTDGEFHTIRRLLSRLEEEGVEVARVPAHPVSDLAGRVSGAVDHRTAAVLVSSVLFEDGLIVPDLRLVQDACLREGAELLVDAYHSVNVAPFSIREDRLEWAFVVGGGYKYLQWGEGACFLRIPPRSTHRPVLTGWFSEFGELAEPPREGMVQYGSGPARFAGSTYDPTAHYRADAVLDHFEELGLTPPLLRSVSRHQVRRLILRLEEGDPDPRVLRLDSGVDPESRAGFLSLRTPFASDFVASLRARGVLTDARGEYLRLGPAPYLSDAQLDDAMAHVLEVAAELGS